MKLRQLYLIKGYYRSWIKQFMMVVIIDQFQLRMREKNKSKLKQMR